MGKGRRQIVATVGVVLDEPAHTMNKAEGLVWEGSWDYRCASCRAVVVGVGVVAAAAAAATVAAVGGP